MKSNLKPTLSILLTLIATSAMASNIEANVRGVETQEPVAEKHINILDWSAIKGVSTLDSAPKSINSVNITTGFVSLSSKVAEKYGIPATEIPIIFAASPSLKDVKSDGAKLAYQFKTKAIQDFHCVGRIFVKKSKEPFATLRCLRIGSKF